VAHLEIKLFAVVRDRLGRDTERLEIDGPLTAGDVLSLLTTRHPDLAPVLGQCRVAVNRVFVASSAPVAEGDEVALIPPVAGG
jgi:molybdopterin converting factor subunit 1